MRNYLEPKFCEYLDTEWPIVIGHNEYPCSEVFKEYAPMDYESTFTEWIEDQKGEARQRVKETLEENGCLPRFNKLAERVLDDHVIPFIGAGMSKPSGFMLWGAFLTEIAKEDPELVPPINDLLAAYDFEGAAQAIAEHFTANILAENIENHFDRQVFDVRGPVGLLPSLFKRGCVTTNFDYVLERTFEDNGCDFVDSFSGEDVKRAPRVAAHEKHVILKLHGTADNHQGRVLTTNEYDDAYGEAGALPELLNFLVSNRSLLFLGCSLGVDRTVSALRELKAATALELPRHYAFLSDPGLENRAARRSELDQAEIHPIWYPVENHEYDHSNWIEGLLLALHGGPIND